MSDFLESLLNNPAITNAMWPAFLETLLMVGISGLATVIVGLPVGVVLFVTSKVANISFEAMSRAIVPWLAPLVAVLIAITLWPPLTLWLPQLLLGK